ncbi:hypothetical protein QE152_g27348 [Popillia japonica]|uniref:C2H2-type domain-containing protein n=1 Tax=Popillia japonica TaxID=7064 RepID=A0AAW1JVW0_POPJA
MQYDSQANLPSSSSVRPIAHCYICNKYTYFKAERRLHNRTHLRGLITLQEAEQDTRDIAELQAEIAQMQAQRLIIEADTDNGIERLDTVSKTIKAATHCSDVLCCVVL